jgi:hypothetical protein
MGVESAALLELRARMMMKIAVWLCVLATVIGGGLATAGLPAMPEVVLSASVYPEGVTDESGYAAWMLGKRHEMTARVEGFTSTWGKAQGNAAIGNWIVSREMAPAMSRYLHRLPADDGSAEVTELRDAAMAALDSAKSFAAAYAEEDVCVGDGGLRW